MNIILTGRPANVVPLKDAVVMLMTGDATPDLPKGLPAPPSSPTTYIVYVVASQWHTIADHLDDPTQSLLVRGWACHDRETESIAVFAQSITLTVAPTPMLNQRVFEHRALEHQTR